MRYMGALSRVARMAALVAVFTVVLVGSSASGATEVAVPGTSVYRWPSMTWPTSSLPKFASVVVQPSLVSTVKSASPSTLVLQYKEAMSVADDCGTGVDGCRTGMTYQQAAAHDSAHPSDPWILRDSAGKPIASTSYAHNYLANVGSASYQQQWATNVIGAAKRLGFDGTTLDNVSANISAWPGWSGVYPTLYPSDSAWETAMKSFIAYVGPQEKAQGLYVRASAGKAGPSDGSATKAWWTALTPYVSGFLVEYFEQASDQVLFYNDPTNWHGYWESWLGLVDVALVPDLVEESTGSRPQLLV